MRPGLQNSKSPGFAEEVGALTGIIFGSYCTEDASTSTVRAVPSA